jgi:hypothetical protein
MDAASLNSTVNISYPILMLLLFVLSVLFMINGFFFRTLINKFNTMASHLPVQEAERKAEMKNMGIQMVALQGEIKQLSHEFKDFGLLRERIAVIEALMTKKKERYADQSQ